ncbi:UNVERIFIED_CONTAM: hypothetical protein GTU68_058103 [Idotea baltica]|nr:hypothetical protein [Idotea baltica]
MEVDWWDQTAFRDLTITFTPSRHFSGRGLTDRAKSLWGGWSLKTPDEHIWVSGDGGYGEHFKEVGRRLGPIDFAMMECGQYNDHWRMIHMFPEESIQAALDAGVRKAMPIHWAGFSLSFQHSWSEPARDFVRYAGAKNLDYATPEIGQLFTIAAAPQSTWWESYEN